MKTLSNFFYSKSNLTLTILATVASFSWLFIVMVNKAKGFEVEGGQVFLGTSFGFNYEMVLEFLSARSIEKLNAYKSFLAIWDGIYPAIYGLQYMLWISYLYQPLMAKSKWLNLLGFIPALFDWLENVQLTTLTNQYLDNNSIAEAGVQLASIFSISKWISSVIVFLIIVVGVLLRLKNYFLAKKQTT